MFYASKKEYVSLSFYSKHKRIAKHSVPDFIVHCMRSEVLMASVVKIAVFWDMTRSLVDRYKCVREICYLQGTITESQSRWQQASYCTFLIQLKNLVYSISYDTFCVQECVLTHQYIVHHLVAVCTSTCIQEPPY